MTTLLQRIVHLAEVPDHAPDVEIVDIGGVGFIWKCVRCKVSAPSGWAKWQHARKDSTGHKCPMRPEVVVDALPVDESEYPARPRAEDRGHARHRRVA